MRFTFVDRQYDKKNTGFSDRTHRQWFSGMTINEYEAMQAKVEAVNNAQHPGWRELKESFEMSREQRLA